MRLHAATELSDKVAALSRADIYDDPELRGAHLCAIECIETHMSWVFLTPRFAYKLKKPVRSDYLDFSTLAARANYCREELLLNRRLAPLVYLDVVPLWRCEGRLQLDGPQPEAGERGEIVDFLVKMIRLPAGRMLDRMLALHSVRGRDLRALAATLAEFYRRTERRAMTALQYRARFTAAIDANCLQLSRPHYALPHTRIARIAAAQLDYVATSTEFAARAAHVVDAHGDLRPEHIYLGEANPAKPLQIIDCLEFQSDFRQLDPVDEVAFLALECARLGAPAIGRAILRMYRVLSGDKVSAQLSAFYQSHRAMVRAVLAIWHLDDPAVREREHWRQRALIYIDIAARAIETAWPAALADTRGGR